MHTEDREYHRPIPFHTTKELLLLQSKGKFLTHQEKEHIKKYQRSQRINHLNKIYKRVLK
jgi:hypothetical protein